MTLTVTLTLTLTSRLAQIKTFTTVYHADSKERFTRSKSHLSDCDYKFTQAKKTLQLLTRFFLVVEKALFIESTLVKSVFILASKLRKRHLQHSRLVTHKNRFFTELVAMING